MNHKRAFTLIELLVVIAIIAILAAILFPVFAQAKRAAKTTSAISNAKQELLGWAMYHDDFDDMQRPRYNACPNTGPQPPYTKENMIWSGYIYPYIKNDKVFLDTMAPDSKYAENWPDRGWMSFGANATIAGWYYTQNPCVHILRNWNDYQDLARTGVLMSSLGGETTAGYRGYLSQTDAVNIKGLSVSDRHAGGTVVGFADWHVKRYPTRAILGNPNAPYQCDNTAFQTGMWWLDKNGARLKLNLSDYCIENP